MQILLQTIAIREAGANTSIAPMTKVDGGQWILRGRPGRLIFIHRPVIANLRQQSSLLDL